MSVNDWEALWATVVLFGCTAAIMVVAFALIVLILKWLR
jgi:hypothetical protein